MATKKPRMSTFFVPGTGIDREVITTDICRYLGNDALVKPGPYTDRSTGETMNGYFVTAYRALTTEQLADLKADSARWDAERRKNPPGRGSSSGEGYRASATRARQQWTDAPPPGPSYQTAMPPNQPHQPPYDRRYADPSPQMRTGQPEYSNMDYTQTQNYSYGPGPQVSYGEVAYGVAPQRQNIAQPPRTVFPPDTGGYGDGRGGPSFPERGQPGYAYNDAGQPIGRSQQQYARDKPPEPYYGRGQPEDSMDYDYEDEGYQEPMQTNPPANTGAPRRSDREDSSRRREGKHRR